MSSLKKCIGCGVDKPRSEYWKAAKNTERLKSRCKPCMIIQRRQYGFKRKPCVRKPRGFAALDDETKQGILDMLSQEPKPKKKHVAEKYNIPYTTFCQWCKKGWVN